MENSKKNTTPISSGGYMVGALFCFVVLMNGIYLHQMGKSVFFFIFMVFNVVAYIKKVKKEIRK